MAIIVKSLKHAIAFFVLVTIFCSVQVSGAMQGAKSKPEASAAPTASKQATAEENEVVPPAAPNALFPAVIARVNGKPILGRELESFVRSEMAKIGNPEWKDLREDFQGQLTLSGINSLVNSKLLYQKALAGGIKATDEEVQAELQNFAKRYGSDAEMNAALAQQMLDRETLQKNIAQDLTISKFIDTTVVKSVKIAPEEVAKYYAANPTMFSHPEVVRSSHILIRGGETQELDALAKQRAEALLARAKKGEDFAKLAKENSIDSSASKGGDLGFGSRQDMVPEFADEIFAMTIGEIRLVKSRYGYHVVKMMEKKKEGLATLEDVKAELTDGLKNEKAQVELTKLINQLKDQAKVEVLIPYGQPLVP
jgi:parvulin-like peptidyl-prolyl isomerase